MSYKVFTAQAGSVEVGATAYQKSVADYTINVIEVGESGRGRRLDSVIVEFVTPFPANDEEKRSGRKLYWAGVGATRSGKTKLIQEDGEQSDSHAIVVLRSPIGFRGGNSHTGDRVPDWSDENRKFLDFPGKILAHGEIAEGIAGRMGNGDQYIVLIEKGVWFRLGLSGRLYGNPNAYYYRFDGEKLLALSPDQRTDLDLW